MMTTSPEHVSSFTAMMYPGLTKRCEHCDGYVSASPEDLVQQLTDAMMQPYNALTRAMQDPTMASMLGMPASGRQAWGGSKPGCDQRQHRGHHHHSDHGEGHGSEGHSDHRHDHHDHHDRDCGCGCRSCSRDDCHCRCCIVDADLVVHTRLGERRVVPFVIENDRRRERDVKLELSSFHTKGGSSTAVVGAVSPTEFTLGPCSEQEVVLLIETKLDDTKDGTKDNTDNTKPETKAAATKAAAASATQVLDRLIDVDECVTAYADLRIEGCDNRSIRIAVSALPRDCHAYHIDCACGCC